MINMLAFPGFDPIPRRRATATKSMGASPGLRLFLALRGQTGPVVSR